ncbi:response regulator transcription factor [Geomonas sp. Red69]|uniref:Response regulator transcription factor n=1 Tax=Geomonas diazotrophica TaxID=2843197 RepID=A0ABX8JEN0_9BACT|nr:MULTISPECIES: response regulator transcription factor [Geomonas]MBU5635976.1 response regulator transcription factor [Geomonas diazotrophica]QWV96845.1 response regulator transcription factor [Geomonas nitrogeniifigens]QXE85947.1 response regulator transcription factor [Geomonas nitrogeniifigens]
MTKRILIIDDDTGLCELLASYLASEGYSVDAVHDGAEGADKALCREYAFVVLDVMLPTLNGFDVLRRIRQSSQVPVLMLTARGDEIDRIVGLEMGADDYLPKPFNPRELVARLRAIQRRNDTFPAGTEPRPDLLQVGDVSLDLGARTVSCAGSPVELTSLEFSVLEALVRQAGNVMSRDELTRQALGREFSSFDRSIDVHVSSLRKKLGPAAGGEERIKSVRGVGYIYAFSSANRAR